jgi:hypothetical protein
MHHLFGEAAAGVAPKVASSLESRSQGLLLIVDSGHEERIALVGVGAIGELQLIGGLHHPESPPV